MGYYINTDSTGKPLPNIGKAAALLADGATPANGTQFEANLICVANRFTHDAAVYCFDEKEYQRICQGNESDENEVTWLIHPKAHHLSKIHP